MAAAQGEASIATDDFLRSEPETLSTTGRRGA